MEAGSLQIHVLRQAQPGVTNDLVLIETVGPSSVENGTGFQKPC